MRGSILQKPDTERWEEWTEIKENECSVHVLEHEHEQICKIAECFLGKDREESEPAGNDEVLHMHRKWVMGKQSEIEDYKM